MMASYDLTFSADQTWQREEEEPRDDRERERATVRSRRG